MNRIKFICSLGCLLFIYSCDTLKISASKSSVSDIAIKWNYSEKVNPIYLPELDSVFDEIIHQFNNENHSFKIHERTANEADYLSVFFTKGKFKSNAGATLGYFVSGIGLATPILVLSASNGSSFFFFYYFPTDKLEIAMQLSPSLSEKGDKGIISKIQSGVLFSSKTSRINKIRSRTYSAIYDALLDLDEQNASKK